jgi:hypothetical protein
MTMMKRETCFGLRSAALLAALTAALLLAGCADALNPGTSAAAGTGQVRVLVNLQSNDADGGNAQSARTVFPEMPDTTALFYKYTFTKGGTPAVKTPGAGGVFTLDAGTYTLTVDAYTEAGFTTKVGTGLGKVGASASFTVNSGNTNPVPIIVTLNPVSTDTTGTFTYTITYPVAAALVSLTWAPAENLTAALDLLADDAGENIDVDETQPPGTTAGIKTLVTPGNYVIQAFLSDGGKTTGKQEVVRIYAGLNTVIDAADPGRAYGFKFEDADFIQYAALDLSSLGANPAAAAIQAAITGIAPYVSGTGAAGDPVVINLIGLDLSNSTDLANLYQGAADAFTGGEFISLDLSGCTTNGTITGMNSATLAVATRDRFAAITLPATVTTLTPESVQGWGPFTKFTSLESISAPGVTNVGSLTFWDCTALTELNLPAAMVIDHEAFYMCTALTTVSIPAADDIGNRAFMGCTALTEVRLGDPAPATLSTEIFRETGVGRTLTIKFPYGGGVSSAWVTTNIASWGGSNSATFAQGVY